MSEPDAYVENGPDGLVLHDPAADGMIAAVEAHNRSIAIHNCRELLKVNQERREYFKQRVVERLFDPKGVVIVFLDMNDTFASVLGVALMPGHDWQAYRDAGQVPVARGLAMREGVVEFLRQCFPDLADKLAGEQELAVLAMTDGYGLVEPA